MKWNGMESNGMESNGMEFLRSITPAKTLSLKQLKKTLLISV
jgi:hypothetical protein